MKILDFELSKANPTVGEYVKAKIEQIQKTPILEFHKIMKESDDDDD